MEAGFSYYRLRQLEIAETEAPWGEAAENMRMMYLANKIAAASDGYTKESRQQAENNSTQIWLKLFGPQPPKGPPSVKELIRKAGSG
jgi:hypothetical protein